MAIEYLDGSVGWKPYVKEMDGAGNSAPRLQIMFAMLLPKH
jgi:hypothetical protein